MTTAFFTRPTHRRLPAIVIAMFALIGGGASAQAPTRAAPGTSAACEQWAVFSTAGNASGRIEVCSSVLKDMPRLREQIALLNQRAANDADARRDLQRFAESLNQLARQLKEQDTKGMLESLVAKLEQSRKASDDEVMDELGRLRLGMANLQRTLQAMGMNEQTKRRAELAMGGEVGASIANLDFEGARGILTRLVSIESKLDVLIEPVEARVLIASDRRRATQQMERFELAGARERCKAVYQELVPVLEASAQAEQNGQFLTARNLLMTVFSRAAQATAELQSLDRLKAGEAAKRLSDEDNFARRLAESQRQLERRERILASQEEYTVQFREQRLASIKDQEQVHRGNEAVSRRLVVEAKDRLAQVLPALREAEALAQATDAQRAQRKIEIDRASDRIAYAQRQVAEAEERVVKERADHDRWEREKREGLAEYLAQRTVDSKPLKAARDYLAAAIAKATTDGQQDPAKAADDLRLAESEASDISNGQKPMPRPRRAKTPPFVLPNPMCA